MSELEPARAVDEHMSATIAFEPGKIPASSPESMTNEELVEIAVGTFRRVQDAMPYIIELRRRFKAAPRGNAQIGGCDSWEQFCEIHLHRTASAIRKAIQQERKPAALKPAVEPGKIPASPVADELSETFYAIRRKSDGTFFRNKWRHNAGLFVVNVNNEMVTRFENRSQIEETFASGEIIYVENPSGRKRFKLDSGEWEIVRVQTTYTFTVLQ